MGFIPKRGLLPPRGLQPRNIWGKRGCGGGVSPAAGRTLASTAARRAGRRRRRFGQHSAGPGGVRGEKRREGGSQKAPTLFRGSGEAERGQPLRDQIPSSGTGRKQTAPKERPDPVLGSCPETGQSFYAPSLGFLGSPHTYLARPGPTASISGHRRVFGAGRLAGGEVDGEVRAPVELLQEGGGSIGTASP